MEPDTSTAAAVDLGQPRLSLLELADYGLLRQQQRGQLLAELAASVPLNAEQERQALEAFQQVQRLADEQALRAYARDHLLSPEAFRRRWRQPMQLQALSRQRFAAKAEARFLERKPQLDQVVYSLLRVRDVGLARELYLRILEDEADFAGLAALHAEGPESKTRGIVGPVPMAQAHPQLADRLRTATPGVLLEPFHVADWWLVVRLEAYESARFDEAMAARMTRELFERWVEQLVDQRIEALRDQLQPKSAPETALTIQPGPRPSLP